MKATFANSMNVLIRAYMNDTLVHGNCYACAVGNLVAAANGYRYTKCVDEYSHRLALVENDGKYCKENNTDNNLVGGEWYDVRFMAHSIGSQAELEVKSIGYSIDEIVRIERAFETAAKGNNADDYMFNGLLAVCDVLADIHGIDLTVKNEFVKQLETVYNS